jgi:hypothetical protein
LDHRNACAQRIYRTFWLNLKLTLIPRVGLIPFCAADIFVVDRGPSARTCLSYAVMQISIESESEFSRRPIRNRNISDKKAKTKGSAAGSPSFGYFFWRSKKSD